MAISVGSVEVDVIPNTQGIYGRLRSQLEPAASRAGGDAGRDAGRSFGAAMQREVGGIGLRIGEEIGRQAGSRITAEIRGSLSNGINQGGAQARAAAVRQGDETGGAFSRSLKTRLEAAFRSLPKLQIGADTSEADSDLQALRVRMETLAGKRIGIDIDAEAAKAEIRLIEAELTRLGAEHPNVQVRADTASAAAELAAVRAEIEAVDGKTARVDVNTSGALSAIFQLTVALAGVAAIPAFPVLAAGAGAFTSSVVAAGVGVGALAAVAIPAFIGIKGALDAQKQAQDAAATATANGGQAAAQAAQRSVQMAGAQQALATAHRTAARQIAQAEQGVTDAVRQAAQSNRNAADQVKQARQALADAYQQAADRSRAANERVQQAEQSLADAQRTARQAQQDLTQARRDAAMELEDLSNRLTDAQLSERDAALSVQEARARLEATRAAGSRASLLDQQRAQLAYDQALQRLKEQQLDTKRLAAEKAVADKAGVAGSETVRSAEERLAAARRGVAAQQKGLAKAQQDAARTQVQNQQAIAAAQDKVAAAQRNVATVQEQGARSVARAQQQLVDAQQSAADSVASAQRQIQSAELSAAGGANAAATAQAKYQAALAKLSPSARETFNAFTSLRTAFKAWSTSLQPAVMPIFTRALNGVKAALPGLTPFVLAAARAITALQARVSAGFKSPWWKSFKADLAASVIPALTGLGISFGRVFKGMAGIVQAFLPHMDHISQRMQALTGRFANWGTSLKGSPEFERFLSYASRTAPLLSGALRQIGSAFLSIGQALSPISGPLLMVIAELARGISIIATHAPWMIQAIYLIIVAVKLWTIAQIALNAAMSANPIVLIGIAIAALVAGIVWAYNRFSWFRTGVQTVWTGIQTVALWAWNTVLKPVFIAFAAAFHAVAAAATWLWQNVLQPVFSFIWTAARVLFAIVVVAVLLPIQLAVRAVGAIFSWLWQNIISPVTGWIAARVVWLYQNFIQPQLWLVRAAVSAVGAAFSWLWRNIVLPVLGWIGARIGWLYRTIVQPTFYAVRLALHATGSVFSWLYNNIVRPVMGWIGDRIGWVWRTLIKPVFDAIKISVGLVGRAFGAAKDAIKKSWDQVVDVTKKPVNFVIKWVYTNGIKKLWDGVASWVGLGKLPAAPKLLAAGGTVGDGWGAAAPMKVNRPTAIVGEGNPRYPEYVIPTDPRYRGRALALHAAAGTQLMEDGGILGSIWGGIKSGAGWLIDRGKDALKAAGSVAAGALEPFFRAGMGVVDGVLKRIPGADTGLGKVVRAVPQKVAGGILSFLRGQDEQSMGGGQWAKPVNVGYGTRFGVAGSMWSSGRHTGLDFPAATGTPVRAVAAGTVSQVATGGPYGQHVQINHGGGLSSLYAHMSAILTTLRARVAQGQQIGRVGATGNVTGPHLHLEARLNGRPVDPMPYLTGGGGAIGGAIPSGQRRAIISQALAAAHVPPPGTLPQWLAGMNTLISRESGWNPRAINRWDSNARSGHPSQGLAQTIPSTWSAYVPGALRSRGILDPVANVAAAIRYIVSRYGNITRVQQANANRPPAGYDSGGYLQPGMNLAFNGTGRPEPVLTRQQLNALTGAAVRGTDGGQLGDLHVQVFVGDREITDIARAEVRRSNGQLVQTLRAGRR
ncbi:peptidoglycan DD-metalloendopeptidase family protein [Streptomyces rimosus]|uniref:peptidoglycan DD-metalloendopeptidase family protein n=1 Tax=Streptomyces rimosus TaxID=1927 RepID=UPI0006B282FC|nr:peptidoglycan DD-metalloendopeptidase family protein [Streptomyces rimosus]